MKEQFGRERGCERVQEKKREGIGNKYYGNFFKEFYCEAEQRNGVEAGECGVGDGREFLISYLTWFNFQNFIFYVYKNLQKS